MLNWYCKYILLPEVQVFSHRTLIFHRGGDVCMLHLLLLGPIWGFLNRPVSYIGKVLGKGKNACSNLSSCLILSVVVLSIFPGVFLFFCRHGPISIVAACTTSKCTSQCILPQWFLKLIHSSTTLVCVEYQLCHANPSSSLTFGISGTGTCLAQLKGRPELLDPVEISCRIL